MKRVWRSAALAAMLSVPLSGRAAVAAASGSDVPQPGAVTALSVVPGSGHADVVVAVEGKAIEIIDFTLESPHRIVVDLKGATLGMPAPFYDKVTRGGITNVRMAQWKPDVVRIVLDIDGPRDYTVVRGEHDVRVAVNGPSAFAAWRSDRGASAGVVTDLSVTPSTESARAVRAARPAAGGPAAGSEQPVKVAARKAAEPQQSQEPRISVDFEDTEIRDVITSFAVFSGRTIVVGKSVSGLVTASIKDQPWDVALRSILQSQGLNALEDATGIITVDSYSNIADRAKVEPLFTHVIAVNYAKAETMANTVKSLLGAGCGGGGERRRAWRSRRPSPPDATTCSARGSASFDEKTNTVIITETPARLADIESYIHDLDIRTPQVSIKAKIISVDRTATEQLGLSYDLGSATTFQNTLVTRFIDAAGTQPVPGTYRVNLTGDGLAGVANASRQYQSSSALSLLYNMTLGGFNLTSFLDAMSQQQLTDVQAEPSVTTVDNKEALLFAGTNIAYLLTPPIVPGPDPGRGAAAPPAGHRHHPACHASRDGEPAGAHGRVRLAGSAADDQRGRADGGQAQQHEPGAGRRRRDRRDQRPHADADREEQDGHSDPDEPPRHRQTVLADRQPGAETGSADSHHAAHRRRRRGRRSARQEALSTAQPC